MKINIVTLCSGMGAQEQALKRLCRDYPELEWELLAWSEIDKSAIKAHNALFPEYADRNLGDMTTCDYSTITLPVDILFYSTPCTSVSQAGRNKGMKEGDDTASALIWHTRRAIEALKPRIAILENVKGMVSGKNLKEFHKWQNVMVGHGYTNFCQILDSQDYGVPQHRERLFMVSIRDCASPFYFPKPFKLEKRIKDILEPAVDESYYFSAEQLGKIISHCERKRLEGCGFKEQFVNPNMGGGNALYYNEICRARNERIYKRDSKPIKIFGRMNSSQDGIIVSEDGINPTLCVGHNNVPKVSERTMRAYQHIH